VNPLLPVHVLAGSLALLSGFGALALRKGGRAHGLAGSWFFASMLTMTLSGAVVAALKPERGTAVIGIFTAYLVATSWATARRRSGEAGRFELYALVVVAGCALAMTTFTLIGFASANGRVDSLPAGVHIPFALVAVLAAAFDLYFLRRGRLSQAQRIARHLWRMCTALLIAAMSFFLGQQKVMPEAIQGSPALFVPILAVLAAMIFWILRVRFSRRFSRNAPTPTTAQPIEARV
jgi:hypothetical protein